MNKHDLREARDSLGMTDNNPCRDCVLYACHTEAERCLNCTWNNPRGLDTKDNQISLTQLLDIVAGDELPQKGNAVSSFYTQEEKRIAILEDSITAIACMAKDLLHDYFVALDPKKETDKKTIIQLFEHYCTKAVIIRHYADVLHGVIKHWDALAKMGDLNPLQDSD